MISTTRDRYEREINHKLPYRLGLKRTISILFKDSEW